MAALFEYVKAMTYGDSCTEEITYTFTQAEDKIRLHKISMDGVFTEDVDARELLNTVKYAEDCVKNPPEMKPWHPYEKLKYRITIPLDKELRQELEESLENNDKDDIERC